MVHILTHCHLGNIFANAGQAMIERSLPRALIGTGRVRVRLVVQGPREELPRLQDFFGDLRSQGALEVVHSEHGIRSAHLSGMDGLLHHGLLDPQFINRIPLVVHVHSMELTGHTRWLLGHCARMWNRSTPYVLIAPSSATARRVEAAQASAVQAGQLSPPVVVKRHGFSAEGLRGGNRSKGRHLLGVEPGARVLLSLNRISPQKCDYHQLLLAFSELAKEEGQEQILCLVGGTSPEDRHYVQELLMLAHKLGVARQVRLIEHLPDTHKPDVLAAADAAISLAVNPQESFGLSLLETMAVGLPTVATHWNGYPEVLHPAYHQWLVPTVASHEVARSMEWRGRNEHLSRACAADFDALLTAMRSAMRGDDVACQHGLAHVEHYDWKIVARELVAIWESLPALTLAPSPEPPSLPRLRSPVEGLPTAYLSRGTILRATGRRFPEALEPSLRLALPQASAEGIQVVVRACQEAGAQLSTLRALGSLEVDELDELVLWLLRTGVLARLPPQDALVNRESTGPCQGISS